MVYQMQAETLNCYGINSKLPNKYRAYEDYLLKFKLERVLTNFQDQ